MNNGWWVLADVSLNCPKLGHVIVQMQVSLLMWQILSAGSEARQRKQVLQLKLKALRDSNTKELRCPHFFLWET